MVWAEDFVSICLQVVCLADKFLLKEKFNKNTEPLEFKEPDYNFPIDLKS